LGGQKCPILSGRGTPAGDIGFAGPSIPVAAEFVPVFVYGANLYARPRSVFIVITSFIIALHFPVATDCLMIQIIFVDDPTLAHASHTLAVALLRPPVATNLDILSRPSVLFSGSLRLLRATLGLNDCH